MKCIVDAQLPKSLSDLLNLRGFDSIHTLDLPNRNATTDKEVIDISINQNRIVITKDTDFLESFILHAKPEKLIIVRTGNIPNTLLRTLFDENIELIKAMISRSNLIEITRNEIAEHD